MKFEFSIDQGINGNRVASMILAETGAIPATIDFQTGLSL
jgi:hypothetical protein